MARKVDRTSPLLRAFALLERVAAADAPLSLADAAAEVALPKPTVHRMVAALENAGLLMREPGGRRVGAGPRLTRLALDVLRQGAAAGPRRAIMQALAAAIGETVQPDHDRRRRRRVSRPRRIGVAVAHRPARGLARAAPLLRQRQAAAGAAAFGAAPAAARRADAHPPHGADARRPARACARARAHPARAGGDRTTRSSSPGSSASRCR